jgi:hypothetical protein
MPASDTRSGCATGRDGSREHSRGAGDSPAGILAVGARERSTGRDWGAYTVGEAAQRHRAGVPEETTEPEVAYARFPKRVPIAYRAGLPYRPRLAPNTGLTPQRPLPPTPD